LRTSAAAKVSKRIEVESVTTYPSELVVLLLPEIDFSIEKLLK
jgi:hypothetical protein